MSLCRNARVTQEYYILNGKGYKEIAYKKLLEYICIWLKR